MSNNNMDQVRDLAQKIAERVKNEPGFKAQVQKDPKETLTAAGLPAEYVSDFVREAQLSDVAGYKADTIFCIIWSL